MKHECWNLSGEKGLFNEDIKRFNMKLQENFTVKFLILGAAGSIGQAVTTEIFKRDIRCCMLLI